MSDGQTQSCEANAPFVSIKLERGESVKWHDGSQWRVGHKLNTDVISRGNRLFVSPFHYSIVQCNDGIWCVPDAILQPYGPRCEACGGDQVVDKFVWDQWRCVGNKKVPCPACGGSGRRP